MGLLGSTIWPVLVSTDEQQLAKTIRIVRKYMKDSVVRPAVSDRMQEESIERVWKRAASAGR
jgi:hypothetical protein